MPMSTDLVEFVLKSGSLGGVADKRALMRSTLGLQYDECSRVLRDPDGVVIRCRPSQFARFLIRRNEQGGQNMFKELTPKLIQEEPFDPPINVVNRQRREYEREE